MPTAEQQREASREMLKALEALEIDKWRLALDIKAMVQKAITAARTAGIKTED